MTYVFESVFKKPKWLVTSHTSNQLTPNTINTPVTILGSEITYEPISNADSVIYEISFYAERINGISYEGLYLQEYNGTSWVEINQRNRKNYGCGGSNTSQSYRYFNHLRYILPAWSGNKQLRLISAPTYANRPTSMHQMTEWDGTSSSNTFCNTTLLVYSI